MIFSYVLSLLHCSCASEIICSSQFVVEMLKMIVDVEAVFGFRLIYRRFPDCKQACICIHCNPLFVDRFIL